MFALGCSLGAAQCGRTEYECTIPGETPTYELQCGGQDNCEKQLSIPVQRPFVLIALDRSCSMKYVIDGRSKWEIATESLLVALDAHPELWWGGLLFPDGVKVGCSQGPIPVPPGPDNQARVVDLLLSPASAPDTPCDTTLGAAVVQMYDAESLREGGRRGAILLISDGQIGCTGGSKNADGQGLSAAEMLQDLYETAGVQTFVLGFGDQVDAETLDELALAGGAPSDGAHAYYVAGSDELGDRVLEVLSRHLDCEYELELDPDGLEGLTVRVDGGPPIPRSSRNGWDYDAARGRLVFSGRICRRLERFEFSSIDLTLDCRALAY